MPDLRSRGVRSSNVNSFKENLPGTGTKKFRQKIENGRLTSPVRTDNRMDRTSTELQIHIIDCNETVEVLRQRRVSRTYWALTQHHHGSGRAHRTSYRSGRVSPAKSGSSARGTANLGLVALPPRERPGRRTYPSAKRLVPPERSRDACSSPKGFRFPRRLDLEQMHRVNMQAVRANMAVLDEEVVDRRRFHPRPLRLSVASVPAAWIALR